MRRSTDLLFVDDATLDSYPGHRLDILDPNLQLAGSAVEVGTVPASGGVLDGVTTPPNSSAGADLLLTGQDFLEPQANGPVFLTGVVYADGKDANPHYQIGLGEAGIGITAYDFQTGQTWSTTTDAGGGYSLAVPANAGQLNVVAYDAATGLGGEGQVPNVGSQNVEVDFPIDDQDTIQVTGQAVSATQYAEFNATLGTITGANTARPPSDFNVQILWDDGSTSTGQVVRDSNVGYSVTGGHAFQQPDIHYGDVVVTAKGDLAVHDLVRVTVASNAMIGMSATRVLVINGAAPASGGAAITLDAVGSQLRATLNGQVDLIDAAELAGVLVSTGSGPSTIDVEHTFLNAPVTLNLGSGTTSVTISGRAQDLDNIAGDVTVQGGGGAYALNIDDQGDTDNHNYFVAGSTVRRSESGTVAYSGTAHVVLNGGSGEEIYHLGNTESGAPPVLTATGPGSTLTVNAAGTAGNQIDLEDVYTLDASHTIHSSLDALPRLTVNGRAADTLTVDETAAFDGAGITRGPQSITVAPGGIAIIQSASASGVSGRLPWKAAMSGVPQVAYGGVGTVVVEGDTRGTTFHVGAGQADLSGLPGRVVVQGGGADPLTIDDLAGIVRPVTLPAGLLSYSSGLTYTVTNQQVSRVASYTYTTRTGGGAGASLNTISYSGVGSLELDSSTAAGPTKTIDVQRTAAGTPVKVVAGRATTINVGTPANSLAGIFGPVTIQGPSDTLNLNSQGDNGLNYVLSATALSLPADVDAITSTAPLVTFAGTSTITFNAGRGNPTTDNSIWPEGVAAGAAVTINSGPSYVISVSGPAATLDTFLGPLTVHGQAPTIDFSISDQDSTTGHTYTLQAVPSLGPTANRLTRGGGAAIAPITYTGMTTLQFSAGTGNDTFNIESIADNYLTRFYGDGGQDTYNLSPTARDLDALSGILDLWATATGGVSAGTTINVYDQAHAAARKWVLEPRGLVVYPSAGSAAQPLQVYTQNVGTANVSGGSGGNTFVVSGIGAGTTETVNSGAGNDTVQMTGSLAAYAGVLAVDGQGGTNALDYSQFAGPVSVDLAHHQATGIRGGLVGNRWTVSGL